MKNGSVAIGVVNPKSPENMGNILRGAGCYGADAVFYTGERFDRARKFLTDTKNTKSKIPVVGLDSLLDAIPLGAHLVAVELVEGATPLMSFQHPEHAYYLFGPEDGSLPQDVIDRCDAVVYIPTIGCMNLSATVNVLLYDRLLKMGGTEVADRPIQVNRDTNNTTKIQPQ